MRYFFWLTLLLLIVIRYATTRPVYSDGDRVRITDTISSEPIQYTDTQYLKLQGLKIYLPKYPEVGYGDRVVIEGVVVDDRLKDPELLKKIETKNFLFAAREKIISFFKRTLPEPHSSLVAGLTMGSKSDIPNKFWNDLKRTGTAHVVVASGMNVTLVGNFLLTVLVKLVNRKRAIIGALFGVWLYTFAAGLDAPLVRAAIMVSIAFLAQEAGRLSFAWRSLFLSAALMLVIKPDWLTDLGFILSFVATASLMLFQSKVNSKVQFIPEIFREGFSTSLAAQIGVAPILFITFGQFNILSPVINALVLWIVPIVTIIGFIAGLLSLLVPQVASLILYLVYPLTLWFITITGL